MKRIAFFAFLFLLFQCQKTEIPSIDFRQEMRNLVMDLSSYARTEIPGFIVIPQNGQELIYLNVEMTGDLAFKYLEAINGVGREDLFYGYEKDNKPTPSSSREYMLQLCEIAEKNKLEVLTIDYCSDLDKMADSYLQNNLHQFISFAAPERNLTVIPNFPEEPFGENENNIKQLSDAKNFLYLINSENYSSKSDFILDIAATNYDLIIIDLFHNEQIFSSDEIKQLKVKQNCGSRLVICYMSIGEAEDYRYYWKPEWEKNLPPWIGKENPDWKGNYKVRYWDYNWHEIIFGTANSYLNLIIRAGFDGVYLDLIDAFEYYEE